MATLDRATAEAILAAFGPCSSVNECMGAGDIIRDFEDGREVYRDGDWHPQEWPTLRAYVLDLLKGEELFWEREADCRSGEESEARIAEHNDWLKEMAARVRELAGEINR